MAAAAAKTMEGAAKTPVDVVRLLVEKGAAANAKDAEGNTALMRSARNREPRQFRLGKLTDRPRVKLGESRYLKVPEVIFVA